jgi:hypothetical protein
MQTSRQLAIGVKVARHRIQLDLDDALYEEWTSKVPKEVRGLIIRQTITKMNLLLETNPANNLGVLVSGNFTINEVIPDEPSPYEAYGLPGTLVKAAKSPSGQFTFLTNDQEKGSNL